MRTKNLVSDSSSDEDRVRLKDATLAESTAYGVVSSEGMPPSAVGGNIVKTTDIRVSDEIDHGGKEDPGAFIKTW